MKNLKSFLLICCLIILVSCTKKSKTVGDAVAIKNYGRLSVIKGYPGEKTVFDTTTAKTILFELNELKTVQGPIKFARTHKFVIEHKSGPNDTLITNGTVFVSENRYYKSEENLIKKFNIN